MKESARTLAWDDFRLINAVAETRNLPAAAARLGIDHSTVFRRLRQVEALLGTPLFERHRTGYTLTPAGEGVAALAARVDEDITAVTRRLAGQAPLPSGELRLATSDSLLSDLLMPMLMRFRRAHPAIRLDLVTGNPALNLSRRDADVAVRATDTPPDTLVGRRTARIAWALYGAEGEECSPEKADWVCLGDNLAGLKVVRFAREAVPAARLAGRFDTVLGLSHAVAAGMGVGHLPCFIGDAWPGLVRLSQPEPDHASDLWLLTHPDLRNTPRVRALLDSLAEQVAAKRPLIEGKAPRQG
ncbi:LysR family transcriptional regulator [Roseomonas xinghualingensis]|uniref:LysR family transcriptional regulator n=1 Tax=Roseomonas xinghualingensis TaxID=2986475 RepID=UPI0021F0E02D|nr:LysR family transcriptional regulator [Roseomonas sp. SXEYE001]MCV4207821.1 LysR family transcriptional regulator [Roseomonas sp. SXEYE001]